MWLPGRIGGGGGEGPEMEKEREEWGNSKEREAGEMSGENYVTIPFKKKRGGSRLCKVREAGADGCPPPPSSLKRLAFCFQGSVCHLPLLSLYVIFACLCCFSFLLFCF